MNISHRMIAFLLMLGALLLPGLARAEVVTSWNSDISVAQSGTVTVRETIVYDPQDGTHHGIIREVPAQMRTTTGERYYTKLALISVTNESGVPQPLADKTVSREHLYLKIGDKDTLIAPGPHTYVITYTITPLVTHTPESDRLLINVIGNNWQTPITRATATIVTPGSVDSSSATCFTGASGSLLSSCTISATTPRSLRASTTRALATGEAFTLDVTIPTQNLAAYLAPGQMPPYSPLEVAAMMLYGLSALLLIIGFFVMVRRAISQYQARHNTTIVPQYDPPVGLTPAHLSIIESPAADVADVTATLIHLAVRGVIKIEQVRPKSLWQAANYRLTRTAGNVSIEPFETTLLDGFFGGKEVVTIDEISSSTRVASAIDTFHTQLGNDVTTRGYFRSSPASAIMKLRWLMPITIIIAGLATSPLLAMGESIITVIIGAILLVLGVVFVWASLRPSGRTQVGNQGWAEIRGFKWFLEVTEKDRLNFTDAPEKTPELFSKMLPYAIALKVEKKWAKQFAGIDVGAAVGGWYGGYVAGNFAADSFTNSFSSSFADAMSSNFGASSGGGSAGGGGGGGGGGGW